MKQNLLLAVTLLLASSQAVKVVQKDVTEINFDYEENVQTSEDEAGKDKKFNSLLKQHQDHMEQNDKLIKEYNMKIDQANRNVAQGIFGRSLATNKVSEIKESMSQIASNFKADESVFPTLV